MHRDRSARYKTHDLYKYVTNDLEERLSICRLPKNFSILDFCGRNEESFSSLNSGFKVHADLSCGMLNKKFKNSVFRVQCDEGYLPFAENTFDVVVSNMHLHWANDIVKVLSDFYRVLKKDGVFVLAMIGGDSISDLRHSFIEVESVLNNVNYHVSPMIKAESLTMLMRGSGFTDVIVDSYNLRLEYNSFYNMIKSFQRSGESHCLQDKVYYLKRSVLSGVSENYTEKHKTAGNGIYCDIEVINAIGYK